MTIQNIPLNQLVPSELNARKRAGNGIAALATSIAAHGLLHNLTVLPAQDGTYQVIDGGRRLLALQQLVKKEKLAADFTVPCLVRDDAGHSTEISAAANAFIEPMHPADQCDAFRRMIDEEKATIADVAARFSVSELIVRQRLKLANVSPRLVDLYRADKLNLEQMQSLAISDDHEAQEHAFFDVKNEWERSGRELRDRLTKKLVSTRDSRVQFVGLDAYVAAGGNVVRDLFAKQDEGFLDDTKLLDRLVREKLAETEQDLLAAGWSWVEMKSNLDYQKRAEYAEVPAKPVVREATPEELAQLQHLHAREEPLLARFNELDDIDARSDDQEEEHDRLNEELQGIEDARFDIEEARKDYAPAVKAASGVLIELGPNGIQIHQARLKPGEKLKKGSLDVIAPKGDAKADKPKRAEHSDAILMALSAHRSHIARSHVLHDPKLALALAVDWLIVRGRHEHNDAGVLRLATVSVRDAVNIAPDVDRKLRTADAAYIADGLASIPKRNLLPWLLQQTEQHLLKLLALGISNGFDAITERDRHEGVDAIQAYAKFDMADHWTPTCDGYLGRVPREIALAAVIEACGKTAAEPLRNLKKDALVAEAAKQLAGTGWLPKPLRGPGYALKKSGTAPATAAKAPAKPKPKKAAKKAAKKGPAKKSAPKIPAGKGAGQ